MAYAVASAYSGVPVHTGQESSFKHRKLTGPGVISRIRKDPRRILHISIVVAGILLFAIFILAFPAS